MFKAHRPLSIGLALLVFVTSVLNVLLVECVAGPDHHRIESIGHLAERASPHAPGAHADAWDAELHPDDCADLPLADHATLQRPVVAGADPGELPAAVAPPLPLAGHPDAHPAARRCPAPPPSMRPVIRELDTVRLLT